MRSAGRKGFLVSAVLLLLITLDLRRPPDRQWTTGIAVTSLHIYQQTLSSLGPMFGIRCRFVPSCSRYAELSIRKNGVITGSWRSLGRILRCNPWMTPMGTADAP